MTAWHRILFDVNSQAVEIPDENSSMVDIDSFINSNRAGSLILSLIYQVFIVLGGSHGKRLEAAVLNKAHFPSRYLFKV